MLSHLSSPGALPPPERHNPYPDRRSLAVAPGPAAEQRGAPGGLHVLVVEDDDAVRAACVGVAQSLGCHVRTAATLPDARDALQHGPLDVVLLDMRLPGGSGYSLLADLQSMHPFAYIVLMTSFASASTVAEAMRNGARDFLQKPFALEQISAVLTSAARLIQSTEASRSLRDRLEAGIAAGRLLGTSEPMQKLYRMVSKVALVRHPVLILGERGTGKEVVARCIHANGLEPASPFVAVDCDALAPDRLEHELFGTASAHGLSAEHPVRPGLIETIANGTLFLSEIQCLHPQLQARMNRSLGDRRAPLPAQPGSVALLRGRLLASSSADLEAAVRQGRFRRDLYDRLNTNTLRIPPLRDRGEDIVLLAEYFLDRERDERDVPFVFSDEALGALLHYPWAGNVGELESAISKACSAASGPVLLFDDMSSQLQNHALATQSDPDADDEQGETLQTLAEIEREAIRLALQFCGGDKIEAARRLGIGKTTLYRKIKDYDLADDIA